MTYYINRVLPVAFDVAVARTKEALKAEGFGVLTEINVQETLKAKIGVDFPKYVILGACNPALAHEALQLENKVGTMLPCNVVVRDAGDGQTEVAAIDPVASMRREPHVFPSPTRAAILPAPTMPKAARTPDGPVRSNSAPRPRDHRMGLPIAA